MKILVCSNAYPPNFIGGAELIAHYHAVALKNLGNEVVVFAGDPTPFGQAPNGPRHSIREEIYEGIKVYRTCLEAVDYQSEYINFFNAPVERYFRDILEKFRPDVVHCHNIIGLSVGILGLAKSYGAKVVLTVHDHWGFCLKNTLIYLDNSVCHDFTRCHNCLSHCSDEGKRFPIRLRTDFIKTQFDQLDLLISPSRYLAEAYISVGFPAHKSKVISNGVAFDRFCKLARRPEPGKTRFTYIGYLADHKGIAVFLESLSHLPATQRDKVRINLVGVGHMVDQYKQQLLRNGYASQVTFWGKIENKDIGRAYEETDVYMLPSIWPENQPVTITEAMASGIPVIGSDLGGVSELVENGQTGYLFQPGNASKLAEAMSIFIEQPDLIATFGQRGRQRMQNNTFTHQATKIQAAYGELLSASLTQPDKKPNLFVCVGNGIDANGEAVLAGAAPDDRFVLDEWLPTQILKQAQLAFVINDKTAPQQLSRTAAQQLPLLVPETNQQLTDTCRRNSCGLYYQGTAEAHACLQYLRDHPETARQLGQNASVTMGKMQNQASE
jgi:glycosyltransferase involved in cell wall biosynthesis